LLETNPHFPTILKNKTNCDLVISKEVILIVVIMGKIFVKLQIIIGGLFKQRRKEI
jgi:hypothetical protein